MHHYEIISLAFKVWSWRNFAGDTARSTGTFNWNTPYRGGVGWDNPFLIKAITCPIPKGALAWPKGVWSQI